MTEPAGQATFRLGQPLSLLAKPLGQPLGQAGPASWPSLLANLLPSLLANLLASLLAKFIGHPLGQASWPASWPASWLASWPASWPSLLPTSGQLLGQASWPASWPGLLASVLAWLVPAWLPVCPHGAQLPPNAKPKPQLLLLAEVSLPINACLFASLAHSRPQTQNLGQEVNI